MAGQPFHSGFTYFVERPDVGKSTLTSALVGQKVAVVSSKLQIARHMVRSIVTCNSGRLVLIDTPGPHRPRILLGERLSETVCETWSEMDVVGICLLCNQRIGPGDRYIVSRVVELSNRPLLVTLATRTDLVSKGRVFSHLVDTSALAGELGIQWAEVAPCSALNNDQVDTVHDVLLRLLPEGPIYYSDGEITDEPEETLIVELIREAALGGVHDELSHSIAVMIDEILPRPDCPEDKPPLGVFASIVAGRDPQKGIIIGYRGSRLREIGIAVRLQINRLLGTLVHLSLHVKVLREWQRDTKYLDRLGFW